MGWQYLHLAIDDCSQVGCCEALGDETGPPTVGILVRAIAWHATQGVRIRGVLTDNGATIAAAAGQPS